MWPLLITCRLFDVHLLYKVQFKSKSWREWKKGKGRKLLEQDREQSFENEKEMHPSSTHSLSSPHFHTPQHILWVLSLPHACHLNAHNLQESRRKVKKAKNDKLSDMNLDHMKSYCSITPYPKKMSKKVKHLLQLKFNSVCVIWVYLCVFVCMRWVGVFVSLIYSNTVSSVKMITNPSKRENKQSGHIPSPVWR